MGSAETLKHRGGLDVDSRIRVDHRPGRFAVSNREERMMNLARVLSDVAGRFGEKHAIVFEGTPYTFREFDRQVERHAAMLDALGITRGDRVALQLSKRMDFLFLHLATLAVGAVTLPLNSEYRAEEVGYFLSDSGSSLFFTEKERFERTRDVVARLPRTRAILVDSGPAEGAGSVAEELGRIGTGFTRSYSASGDDPAMICYTSGTTGRSKGAIITHRNLVANMTDLKTVWRWSERDVLLHVLPLFHVHGLVVAAHGGLNAGSTIVMHEKFDPARTWDTLESERCTLLMGVPTIYQRLMNEWDRRTRKPDLSSMRVFISGSAPLSEHLFRRFEAATGHRILERYGMTETGMNTSNLYEPHGRVAGSVGYPLPGVQIRVVSEHGEDVPPGEVGEVLIRGDNVFKGYWQMPEKTEESFFGSWFRSGDLGYQDPEDDLRLYLVGRAKELIITGGYNVYPKEVETVLDSHSAVRESAVFGVPDEDFGERVTAAVVLNPEAEPVTEEDLRTLCSDRLAGYKCPKRVLFLDALPRNAMGKVQKNRLSERYSPSG